MIALASVGMATSAGAAPATGRARLAVDRPLSQAGSISKVTTETLSSLASSPVVQSTVTGIDGTYSAGRLRVTWGAGDSLTVSGAGPLTSGMSLTGSTATIAVFVGQQCGPTGSLSAVSIEQFTLNHVGGLESVVLQFGCITGLGSFIVSGTIGVNVASSTRSPGYNLVEADGVISPFGGGVFMNGFDNPESFEFNEPVAGMATTALDGGYWLVAQDGGVFAFGDAPFYGSAGNLQLNQPIVGMATTPDGKGYWLVAADGGIFSYGDAQFYGSTGNIVLNQPIVGMAATPDGKGYWLVAADGGIFSYGDAQFYGSTGNIVLNQPVVGMAATQDGGGYWLVAADGGVFAFGDAPFYGSAGNIPLASPIVSVAPTADGKGYWMAGADGGVFAFGDAQFYGSLGGTDTFDVVGIVR
ncbi:MAG: hypothetical protein ABSB09_14925 [Acidimicrobiales bacterium]